LNFENLKYGNDCRKYSETRGNLVNFSLIQIENLRCNQDSIAVEKFTLAKFLINF